jgi:hypothetical protein
MNEAKIYTRQDVENAFKFMGLKSGDYDSVDKTYKQLARKFHPDLGGDAEKMKELNDAKEALDQGSKVSAGTAYNREWWDRVNKEHEEGNASLLASLDSKLRPSLEKYTGYFEGVTGQRFNFKVKTRSSKDGAILDAEWLSDDKSKYFTLQFWLRFSPSHGALGSSQNKEFDAYFESYMFLDGKKFKIGKREWKKFNASEFENPEVIFPSAKIKKSSSVAKDKPIKRADFLKYLQVNMDGHSNGDNDWWYIPLGKKLDAPHALALHRTVMLRQAMWYISIAGLVGSEKYRHYTTGSVNSIKKGLTYTSFYENRKFMDYLPEMVKEAKKASDSGDGTKFQEYLNKIKLEINAAPTSEAKIVDLVKNCAYHKLYEFKPEGVKTMKTNLSENYMKMFEQDAKDHVSLEDDTTKKGLDGQDNDTPVVEQAEAAGELPQKLTMAMDRLSKKPMNDKVELQAALLQELVKVVQGLPQAQKLLKDFGATAAQIVLKGEAEVPAE